MACTCKKSNSTNRCCNSCTDVGCKDIVYPKCILTETAYTCIGVGAGKTGSALFAAIDSALCTLQNKSTIVEGCTQALDNGDYITITSTPSTTNGTTTYTVCLGDDIISFFNGVQSSLTNINSAIDSTSACLFDSSGGCQVENLDVRITTIEGNIVTIENDITTINNTLDTLEDETWKTIGDAGNMANGEPIPTFGPQTTPVVGRLRHKAANHTEVQFIGTVSVPDTIQNRGMFILPTLGTGPAYRPTTIVQYPACGELTGGGFWVGYIRVDNSTGVVSVTVVEPVFVTDTDIELSYCILIPTD